MNAVLVLNEKGMIKGMSKKLLLLVISCVLLCSCTGCSENQLKGENVNQTFSENQTEEQSNTIIWWVYEQSQVSDESFSYIWQEPLNHLLKEKGVPYEVKIEVYYDLEKDVERLSPAEALEHLKSENLQADIISVPTGITGFDAYGEKLYAYYSSYRDMGTNKLLVPLDDMLEADKGIKIKENVTGPELKRLQVDGVTYGIAQHMRTFNSVIYRKDLLQKYGIGIEELSDDIFENEDILKMVCDGENGKIVPYVTDMGVLNRLGFWVIDECELLVYGRNGKFMNAFETEELRNYLSQMKHLWDQNLISTYAQSAGEFFSGVYYCDTNQIYETVYKVYHPGQGEEEIDIVVIPNKKLPTLALYGGDSATGISAWSKYQKEAFDFLSLLYTDADIANLIQYGVENVDYSVQNGYVVYNQNNPLRNYGEHFTNPLLTYPGEGMQEDKRNMLEQCYEENETHMPNGFRFNTKSVQQEKDAVGEILGRSGEYTDEVIKLFMGEVDDLDAALKSFNQKLKAAGADKIVAEANRQLEEWRGKYE